MVTKGLLTALMKHRRPNHAEVSEQNWSNALFCKKVQILANLFLKILTLGVLSVNENIEGDR